MSSEESDGTYRPNAGNLAFFEGFLWAFALVGLALFLWGVLAPSPGRAPLGAQLILYGILASVTGTMVFLSARAARRYRRLRLTGLAASMTVRISDDGLRIATTDGAQSYRWQDFIRVAPDTDFTAVGPFRQGTIGGLVMLRAGPAAGDRPGRMAVSQAVARGHFTPVETDAMVVIPLRFFDTPTAKALVAAASALHQRAVKDGTSAHG